MINRLKHVFPTSIGIIVLALLFTLHINSCSQKSPELPKRKIKVDLQNSVKEFLLKAEQWPDGLDLKSLDTLKSYYKAIDYKPIWIKDNLKFKDFQDIAQYFSQLDHQHGLNPERYQFGLIDSLANRLEQYRQHEDSLSEEEIALLELATSSALLRLSHHLQYGIINPKDIPAFEYHLPKEEIDSSVYFAILENHDIEEYLESLRPRNIQYLKSQALLDYFIGLDGIDIPLIEIPTTEKFKIFPGDSFNQMTLVLRRIQMINNKLNFKVPDSLTYYDSTYIPYIKEFQSNYGLYVDGVLGKRSLSALNNNPEEYADRMRVSLERQRWNRIREQDAYIWVNIPEFTLYAYRDGQLQKTMKVCTGTKRPKRFDREWEEYMKTEKRGPSPRDLQTPNISGEIEYFVLNPKWLIPENIANKEIIYKLIDNPDYLTEQQMNAFLDGEIIDPDTIEWSDYVGKKMPFKLRQRPGRLNALGTIKFIFRNNFSVYLHDTPSKSAFNLANRAVSHGCVRVQEPYELLSFLHTDVEKWHYDDAMMELGFAPEDKKDKDYKDRKELFKAYKDSLKSPTFKNEKESKVVYLKKKIPVYIDYQTIWVDSTNTIQIRNDVYGKDEELLELLSQ